MEINIGKQGRDFIADAMHIFVLASFALAQPLFDLLGRNAEFFVVRRSEPVDIFLFILVVCILLPGLIVLAEAAAGLLGRRTRKGIHGLAVAFLVAGIALQALKRVGGFPGSYLVTAAIALGIALTIVYLRFSAVRVYVTVLVPALLIFPGLFLFYSPVSKVVFAQPRPEASPSEINATAPIVMVIFDELPLTSLMDEHHQIDPVRYPHFAALAKDATWFRNTTTVGELSQFAVPAILTGNYPDPDSLPTAAEYPNNIFTLLGGTYRLKACGPITAMCPADLCGKSSESFAGRLSFLLSDLSIVYLHVLLPEDLSAGLPPITQNWMGFASHGTEAQNSPKVPLQPKTFWKLWIERGRHKDRSEQFMEFVNGIDSSDEPTLYFLHVLLPHVPFEYLPSGRIYSAGRRHHGLDAKYWDKWIDEWAVIQSYQRHLLQVGFVDTLLGKLLTHLKTVGLYDSSLIVITSDHGASFRLGDFRRALTTTNFQDIMPVPLFVKAPNQHEAAVNDRNVETIDILPTIADILGFGVPWPTDGSSALDPSLPERETKGIFYRVSRDPMVFDSAALESRYGTLERKLALFGSGREVGLFKIGPYSELVGKRVVDIDVRGDAEIRTGIYLPLLSFNSSADAEFVPAYITGDVHSGWDGSALLSLAIAINGTIRATTQTYSYAVPKKAEAWSAVVDEASFRDGLNDLEVFVVSSAGDRPILKRSYKMEKFRHYLNVALGATWVPGAGESGFHNQEWWGATAIRWTNGAAKLVIPVEEDNPPKALRVALASTGPKGTKLRVLVNGHEIFDQRIAAGGWSETLSLGQHLLGREITIELVSDTFVPMEVNERSTDPRTLGVAVKGITLLEGE